MYKKKLIKNIKKNLLKIINKNKIFKINSAENGIRTHAGDCPPDLKSGALPGFAISAYVLKK